MFFTDHMMCTVQAWHASDSRHILFLEQHPTPCEYWRRSQSQFSGSQASRCMSIVTGFYMILKRARVISQKFIASR